MAEIKDYLLDIIKHTHGLGIIDLVKVSNEDGTTHIDGVNDKKNVILLGTTHELVKEFSGSFGMPNLSKLNMLLGCNEYAENANISLEVSKDKGPVSIHFTNALGDFKNDYRLMNQNVVQEKLKPIKFKQPKWDVEFSPTLASINRLSFQASVHSETETFTFKTDNNNNVICSFGDAANHAGEFVFSSGASGKLIDSNKWPTSYICSILKLNDSSASCKISISNESLMEIAIDSGLAQYNYYIVGFAG